jgi:hypothetical protein
MVFGDYASIRVLADPRGVPVMDRLDLFKSRSYIVYEPPLPILPTGTTAAVSNRRAATFKMYDLESGRIKRTGRVTHWLKAVSHSQFDTPAGLLEGYYVDIEHAMDMRYAKLHFALRLGCRLDEGPIYGSGQYTLTNL